MRSTLKGLKKWSLLIEILRRPRINEKRPGRSRIELRRLVEVPRSCRIRTCRPLCTNLALLTWRTSSICCRIATMTINFLIRKRGVTGVGVTRGLGLAHTEWLEEIYRGWVWISDTQPGGIRSPSLCDFAPVNKRKQDMFELLLSSAWDMCSCGLSSLKQRSV